MTRYVLVTHIISHPAEAALSKSLVAWMAEQSDDDLFIASLTLAEIRRGVLEKPPGKRRDQLDAWFSGPQAPQALFAGRILAFDGSVALAWAQLMASGKAGGRPRSGLDTIIAAVVAVNDCVVVTDNERDFVGVDVINSLRGASAAERSGAAERCGKRNYPCSRTEPRGMGGVYRGVRRG